MRDALAAALLRVADGDESAMETVYRRTSAKLYGLLLHMLPRTGPWRMRCSRTPIWRYGGGRTASSQASPMTWLITVARNKAIDRVRSEQIMRRSAVLGEEADPPDPAPSALSGLEAATKRQLDVCLDQLDARQRHAMRTAFFSDVTYEDLAEREGVPLGTMKSWIRRGLLRLRACLEP
jgi:RNA polymerase sigma-70 factor (ECF subfamily)